jgi:signal transduction histidine kinase/CheY-like chemotaxis protein/ligand-binding sensor domain-containing protein
MRNRCFLLFWLLVPSVKLMAQVPLQPEIITIRQGLSQSFVPCLLQDREGFIWAGTKNGLNRYDGRVFEVFTHDAEDPFSLSGDFIWTLEEFGDYLLIGNNEGILDFFNKRTRHFYHLPLTGGTSTSMPLVQDIFVDAGQHIWVLGGDEHLRQLYFIRTPTDFWKNLPGNPSLLHSLKVENCGIGPVYSAVISSDHQTIYLDKTEGIFSLDTRNAKQVMIKGNNNYIKGTFWSRLRKDPQGNIWIAKKDSLFCYDGFGINSFLIDINISLFPGISPQGELLMGIGEDLLAIPQDKIRAAGRVSQELAVWKTSCTGAPNTIIGDYTGNIWIGMSDGILKVKPRTQPLWHHFQGNSIYGSIFSEKDGTVGSLGTTGLNIFPANSSSPVARLARQPGAGAYANWRITTDKKGVRWLYISSINDKSSLVRIAEDGTTRAFSLPHQPKGRGNITSDNTDGSIWLAFPWELLHFDPVANTWQTYSFQHLLPYELEVFCLQKMQNGTIWIGTQGGLLESIPDGKGGINFRLLKNELNNPHSIGHNAVSSLLTDPSDPGVLWVGTKGGGLNRLDTRTRRFSHLTQKNGLPNDVIYGILPDTSGNLWMSSNKGIIRYTPKTGSIRNFTVDDGLQSDEFNTWAYASGPAGTLMFGGINGLNVFSPARFADNPNIPKVYLTGLKINNKAIAAGDSTGILIQAIEFSKKISLKYNQQNITFEFAALEFTASAKNRFKWILEGAEKEWHSGSTDRSATYLNLSPGNYTFKVMASNGDGVWNPVPAILVIHISPPWWNSWLAWFFYIAAAGFTLRKLFDFQTKRRLEHTEMQLLKELDMFKSRLYVNITHEFRTPLTVILGLAREVKGDPGHWTKETLMKLFDPIERNGSRLLRLINQMLDLAKLENSSLHPELRHGDIISYLRYLLESFQSLANAGKLTLQFSSPLLHFEMDFDPERLSQIVSNLVTNALKNTPPGGLVSMNVVTITDNRLQLEIRDTGTGIPPEALPYIFDRFYQVPKVNNGPASPVRFDESHNGGTGIGLALTYELVKLFGGEIRVESRTQGTDRGTVFTIRLPVTHLASALPAGKESPKGNLQEIPSDDLKAISPVVPQDQELPLLLLVEDNADVVNFLRTMLEPFYRVVETYNGQEGIAMAFETIPDIVVTDLMMPEMDGLQLCDKLKNDSRTSHIPIVLLTARAAIEDRIAGLSRGADAYLVKPVHKEELLITLSGLIKLRQQLRERYAAITLQSPAPTEDKDLQIEDAFLQKLRAVVESQLSNADLSVEDICRKIGMSHPVIHRKITALTGRSLTLFVRSVRLQHACQWLLNTDWSISEIAYEAGFNDPKFFSRVFSEAFGMSPTVYKQNAGNKL